MGTLHSSAQVLYYLFIEEDGTKIVNHVKKVENLSEEFQDLMDHYQLPVKLEHHNSSRGGKCLRAEDLSREAIQKSRIGSKLVAERRRRSREGIWSETAGLR